MGPLGKPIMDTSRMVAAQKRRRKRERMGVDPKCEELARHFLSDFDNKPEDITELAEIIQSRVEGFIADTFGDEAESALEDARRRDPNFDLHGGLLL